MSLINNLGLERNPVLLWSSCLLMVSVVSFLILPKLVQSGSVVSAAETCAIYTVQPVSCSVVPGFLSVNWKANIQMSEPLDPNIKGVLSYVRARIGGAYADVRLEEQEAESNGLLRVQIQGDHNSSLPSVPQVIVDSAYTLPSGAQTHCRSLPLTCSQ
jgi:hypothetical protein